MRLRNSTGPDLLAPNQWGVRVRGVEFDDFSGFQQEIVFAEDQAEPAVEDVDPVVSLMGTQGGFT